MTDAVLLGIPLDLGAENLGVDIGPNAFRYQGIVQKLQQAGIQIDDLGDIPCKPRKIIPIGNPKLKYLSEILRVSEKAAQVLYKSITQGKKAIVLGGDHSLTLGAFSGAAVALASELGLIYFDAHGDMNTEKTTVTGNIHGMHLASLMGFGAKALVNVYKDGVKLQKNHLLHIGGCDFDQAEKELAKKENLQMFSIADLMARGMEPLFQMIDQLQTQVHTIWVSLDLDAIDSMYAPGVGMPNRGGLLYREIAALAAYIGQHCHVIGVDVVEYNPLQDVEQKTAELGIELIAKFLGHNYSCYTNYLKKNAVR